RKLASLMDQALLLVRNQLLGKTKKFISNASTETDFEIIFDNMLFFLQLQLRINTHITVVDNQMHQYDNVTAILVDLIVSHGTTRFHLLYLILGLHSRVLKAKLEHASIVFGNFHGDETRRRFLA